MARPGQVALHHTLVALRRIVRSAARTVAELLVPVLVLSMVADTSWFWWLPGSYSSCWRLSAAAAAVGRRTIVVVVWPTIVVDVAGE